MTGLLRELFQIAMLRAGPANLPSSWASVAVFALLYAAVDVMIILLDDGYRVVARTAFDLALSLTVIGFLLAVTGRLHRLPQTLVAVYGAYALLSPAMAVLLLAGLPAGEPGHRALCHDGLGPDRALVPADRRPRSAYRAGYRPRDRG